MLRANPCVQLHGFSFELVSGFASGFPQMFHGPGIFFFLGSLSCFLFHSHHFMRIPLRMIHTESDVSYAACIPWLSFEICVEAAQQLLHGACLQNQRSAASLSGSWASWGQGRSSLWMPGQRGSEHRDMNPEEAECHSGVLFQGKSLKQAYTFYLCLLSPQWVGVTDYRGVPKTSFLLSLWKMFGLFSWLISMVAQASSSDYSLQCTPPYLDLISLTIMPYCPQL